MDLFHYTSPNALRAIAQHGLTVGDVPTDLRGRGKGLCGVWLTESTNPSDHGLGGGRLQKTHCRLTVRVPDGSPHLHRWSDWAPRHVEQESLRILHQAAGAAANPASWYVYFGWLPPKMVERVEHTETGSPIDDWPHYWPDFDSIPGVPFDERDKWHRRLLQDVRKQVRRSRNV